MTALKTFGQIAWEADYKGFAITWNHRLVGPEVKAHWERIAAAVALECSRICTEIAAEHLRQAQHSDGSPAPDYRQQAALECAGAIREAIK